MNGCLKAGLIAAFVGCGAGALLVGSCAYFAYKGIKDLPPESRREVLYPRYRTTIEYLDDTIQTSTTLDDAKRVFSEITVPDEVLYIVAHPKGTSLHTDESKVEILKRGSWSSHSSFTTNGAGYGSLSDKFTKVPVFVIQSSAKLSSGSEIDYTIFIRDTKATAVELEPTK